MLILTVIKHRRTIARKHLSFSYISSNKGYTVLLRTIGNSATSRLSLVEDKFPSLSPYSSLLPLFDITDDSTSVITFVLLCSNKNMLITPPKIILE